MKRVFSLLAMAVILLLSACGGGSGTPATTEVGEEGLEEIAAVVSATGIVVPVRHATLSLPAAGVAVEVSVKEGDEVEAGQSLVALSGKAKLEAALSAANLERVLAEQALDTLREQGSLAIAQAQTELANARDALHDAEYKWRVHQKGYRANSDVIEGAEANLVLAEEEVRLAEHEYGKYSGRGEDDPARALALSNLSAARQHRDSVLRSLNWYRGQPTDIQQAQLDADVATAEARLQEAQRVMGRLGEDGVDPRTLEAAEARLANAESQVRAAEAALAEMELVAPFDGVAAAIHIVEHEWVAPGQPLIDLGDLGSLRVETTDLNEIDAARVSAGDPASVTFDALPDVVVTGKVESVSPKASQGAGVNYKVIISLGEIPEGLLWGMTAFVDIQVGD